MNPFFHGTAAVTLSELLAQATYRIRLHASALAGAIRPGQFVMIRIPGITDPLLGRPFALYDTVLDSEGQPTAIDIVYQVVGKLTRLLTTLAIGDLVEIWGPLGNGFPDLPGLDHVALVAGGIGQTPFLAYIRQLLGQRGYGGQPAQRSVQRVSLFYGVRSAPFVAGVDDFRRAGATVHLATDDGSLGFHGFGTELLETQERAQHLIGCGPEPMLKVLADQSRRWDTPCHLSLETPMACGIGICFSCVTRVQIEGGWDYCRVCVDGPVFDAAKLCWADS
jgi:dihydroorotate dehydrogenase electron transfer subunit